MKQATLYVGLSGSYKELGMNDTERLIEDHLLALATAFGGYTKQVCTGGWISPSYELVHDTTLRIEILLTHEHHVEQLREYATDICTDFGEDCIMLVVKECEGEFITGRNV